MVYVTKDNIVKILPDPIVTRGYYKFAKPGY